MKKFCPNCGKEIRTWFDHVRTIDEFTGEEFDGCTGRKITEQAAPFTPGPHRAVTDMDGRHQAIPIMAEGYEFDDNDNWPYHPKLGVVFHGRGHAPRKVAEATAHLWAAAADLLESVEEMLELINNETRLHGRNEWQNAMIAACYAMGKAKGEL